MGVTHYRVRLTVKGLVHIGNGRQYGGKDYFLLQGKICILDPVKFVGQLNPEQLTNYCSFLKEKSSRGLEEYLQEQNLHEQAVKAQAYQVDTKLSPNRRGDYRYLDVFEFMKDPYGCPYVPGSSFKGMLRTVLLSAIISKNPKSFQELYRENDSGYEWRKNKNADTKIEAEAFRKEHPDPADSGIVNDIMRFISVSDSRPLSTTDLVFARKYDKFAEGDDAAHKRRMGNRSTDSIAAGNDLNIYRECLKPSTVIELCLSIDERINEYLSFAFDTKGIESVFEQFNERYETCFLDYFDIDPHGDNEREVGEKTSDNGRCRYVAKEGPFAGTPCRNRAVGDTGYCNVHKGAAQAESSAIAPPKSLICYLGGGVDFDSKTVLNALFSTREGRLFEIARILYEQFPTRIDQRKHPRLWKDVEAAEFYPKPMNTQFGRNGRVSKAKDDHRHWMDQDLGVSPHTLKLGKVGGDMFLMGRCEMTVVPLQGDANNEEGIR